MAQEWLEVLDKRNRTSKTKRLHIDDQPTRKFSYDGQVGRSMHYEDVGGAWQDVDDTAEEPDTDGFFVKFTKLSYFVRVGDDGRRRFYPDRNDLSYWIEFKKPFPSMGLPTRQNRWFYWDFPHAVIGVRCDVDSLKFGFRLKDNQAPTSITIPFETQGITRQGRLLLHNGEVVAELRKPIATGSNFDGEGMPVQKECDVVFGPGEVTISLDPTGLEYPIEIDPTVDKQVAATGDDGFRTTGSTAFNTDSGTLYSGYLPHEAWYHTHFFARWIGVSIEGTIDVSYIEVNKAAASETPEMKVYGVDEDNPAAPTSDGEFDADPLTTAGVDWDGAWGSLWNESPSLNAIFQELVDTFTISDDAVMLQVKNDHGVTGGYEYNACKSYDVSAGVDAPKLHIEYSVGAEEYSLEIGAGSYALTGVAAGLPLGRVMGASAGSYGVTGAAVGLKKDLLIGVGVGSYALAGSAVSLLRDLLMGVGAGGYALSGSAVGLPVDRVIGAGVGSYALSGDAVSLPIDRIVGAGSGSYSLTGAAAVLLKDMLMAAAAGNYTITGISVPSAFGMLASPGAYALTGAAATLLKDMLMSAGLGEYGITGTSVPFTLGMSASPGAYNITGAALTLIKEVLLSVAAGDYAITGTQVSLPLDRVMGAGSGAYALTGAVADLLKDVLISAAAGSYTLTGSNIDLLKALIIAADGGAYTLSGAAVSLLLDWVLSAGVGAYTITGADVALLRTLIMAAAGGSYTITGADVALLLRIIMAAESGSYIITGSNVDLFKAMILAMGGSSYAITGSDLDLFKAMILAMDSGSYVVTGQAVDLTFVLHVWARYALHAKERSFALHPEKRSFDLTAEDGDE